MRGRKQQPRQRTIIATKQNNCLKTKTNNKHFLLEKNINIIWYFEIKMTITKIKSYLFEKLGWGGIIIIILFAALIISSQIQKYQLNKNASFAKGVIVGKGTGAKGSIYWHFIFYASGDKIESWMPYDKKYGVGDTITIKYQVDDPHKNVLLK